VRDTIEGLVLLAFLVDDGARANYLVAEVWLSRSLVYGESKELILIQLPPQPSAGSHVNVVIPLRCCYLLMVDISDLVAGGLILAHDLTTWIEVPPAWIAHAMIDLITRTLDQLFTDTWWINCKMRKQWVRKFDD